MRISTTSCLCPFLVCLCFFQRYCGASHHVPTKTPSKNQTKLANGEAEVHHRPKRGWIWNQFFVLEEHMGPDAQYVGKVGFHWADGNCKKRNRLIPGNSLRSIFLLVYWEIGYSGSKLFCWGTVLRRHCTRFYPLMWKFRFHMGRCVVLCLIWIALMIMSRKKGFLL